MFEALAMGLHNALTEKHLSDQESVAAKIMHSFTYRASQDGCLASTAVRSLEVVEMQLFTGDQPSRCCAGMDQTISLISIHLDRDDGDA